MSFSRKLVLVSVSLGALVLLPSACHPAHAADAARAMTPTIDVEVEDRAADKSTHVMRFSLSVIDGHAQLKTRDGEAKYDLVAHSSPSTTPHFALSLKRSDTAAAGDIELSSRDPPRSRSTRARCEDRSRRRKVHDHRRAGALTG